MSSTSCSKSWWHDWSARYSVFDVTKAEVDVTNAKVSLIRIRNQAQPVQVQLKNATGMHPNTNNSVRENFTMRRTHWSPPYGDSICPRSRSTLTILGARSTFRCSAVGTRV